MKPAELVADVACRTGEGPLWHPEEQCLYWMDIPNGHLFRYDAASGEIHRVLEGPVLGAATLQYDGSIAVLGIHGGVWRWNGDALDALIPETSPARGTRFNDALADPAGRILSGTMPTSHQSSTLYCLEPNGQWRELISGLGQSNGMSLSADQRTLYHADTRYRVVRAFAYDVGEGSIGPPVVFARFPECAGAPDGMAIDAEGMLWVALWGGSAVVRLDRKGREIARIPVPVPRVSSVAFGGADLSDLYITTAGGDNRAQHGSLAGSVFRAQPGVRGAPRHRSAVLVPNDQA